MPKDQKAPVRTKARKKQRKLVSKSRQSALIERETGESKPVSANASSIVNGLAASFLKDLTSNANQIATSQEFKTLNEAVCEASLREILPPELSESFFKQWDKQRTTSTKAWTFFHKKEAHTPYTHAHMIFFSLTK